MTTKEAQIALANLKRYMSGGGVADRGTNKAIDMAIKALEKPEQKKGRWIRKVEPYAWRWDTWVCSECGEETTFTIMGKPRCQWCPMCGADMREGEDG